MSSKNKHPVKRMTIKRTVADLKEEDRKQVARILQVLTDVLVCVKTATMALEEKKPNVKAALDILKPFAEIDLSGAKA